MVTHVRSADSSSSGEAKHTGEMRVVYWAGEVSFSSVRSLFMVAEFQFGCVMACGARNGLCRRGRAQPLRFDGC